MSTIYIAGPIEGSPEFAQSFGEAERLLIAAGWNPANPTKLGALPSHADREFDYFMERCIRMVTTSRGVATLKGWQRSFGARMEVEVAIGLGIPVMDVERWVYLGVVMNSEEMLLFLDRP